jgi:hypothetical protein
MSALLWVSKLLWPSALPSMSVLQSAFALRLAATWPVVSPLAVPQLAALQAHSQQGRARSCRGYRENENRLFEAAFSLP